MFFSRKLFMNCIIPGWERFSNILYNQRKGHQMHYLFVNRMFLLTNVQSFETHNHIRPGSNYTKESSWMICSDQNRMFMSEPFFGQQVVLQAMN
jgi:hypothetical protein